jgi:hypothetical protein
MRFRIARGLEAKRRGAARLLLFAGICASGLVALPREAFACSCGPIPGVAEELEAADAVFSAEAVKLEVLPSWWSTSDTKPEADLLDQDPGEPATRVLRATFAVIRAWKGVDTPTVVIRTAADCCLCGTTFSIGQRYLVYAYRSKRGGQLWANVCSRTRGLDDAADDVKSLGTPVKDFEKARARGSTGPDGQR